MILITSISIGDGVVYAISFLHLPHDVLFGPTYGSYDLFMIALLEMVMQRDVDLRSITTTIFDQDRLNRNRALSSLTRVA
jgi:hypothetical protein